MGANSDNYRIDSKVITAMLVCAVFFLLLMAFRYKNTQPCPTVDFSFRTANKFDVAYEKEKVYFSSEVKYDANEWEWDFGDKTPVDKKSGPYPSHEYAAPGVYTVRLTINGRCQQVKNISVDKRERTKAKLYLQPVWPSGIIYAGRDYYFGDSTSGATSWSWYFDKDETKRTKQSITYQFVEPGDYKVILVVNDDLENGKAEQTFTVVAPPKINSPVVVNNNPGNPGRNPGSDIPDNPPPGGVVSPGPSLEDLLKVPSLGEASLKAYVLDINGGGSDRLKQFLKNSSFANCSILFNGRSINLDQLKENMKKHAEYGNSLSAKQEVDPKEGYIKVIEITADLKRRRVLLGTRGREYPY